MKIMQHLLITQLSELLAVHADPAIKQAKEAYMRHKFVFFGLQRPVRTLLQKQVFKAHPVRTIDDLTTLVVQLWALQERELHYVAVDLLQQYKKLWNHDTLRLLEHCIVTNSWWDTIDDLAANCVGDLCAKFPELVATMDQWIVHENFWLRRTALLFQLRYKTKTDTERLFAYCRATMHEKEFFIRKAIGWVLREYSKTDPHKVSAFVKEQRTTLSPLSMREALKYCPPIV